MKESYAEGPTSHGGPESCVGTRKGESEALTGILAGRPLSCEIVTQRRQPWVDRGAEAVDWCRRPHRCCRVGEAVTNPARSKTPHTRGNILHGNREIPRPTVPRCKAWEAVRIVKPQRYTTMSHGRGKSDCCVVPQKPPNKAVGEIPVAAEAVEGRRQAKGNAVAAHMSRTLRREYDMGKALEGIRQTDHNVGSSLPKVRAVCGNSARTDLWRGCRVTGIPTPTTPSQ
jgi:hypothetical protein